MQINKVDGLMGAKIQIEHNSAGWANIFKSDGMRELVDAAGQRIAAEAGEHFEYRQSSNDRVTVAGFVSAIDEEGDELEATDKVLTRAVHA